MSDSDSIIRQLADATELAIRDLAVLRHDILATLFIAGLTPDNERIIRQIADRAGAIRARLRAAADDANK